MMLTTASVFVALAVLPSTTSALSWPTSSSTSDTLNGIPVELAFQHRLQKDFAALGWNVSNPVGSQTDSADLPLDDPILLVAHRSDGHKARMRRAAKKAAAAPPAKYQSGRKVRGVNIGSWLVTEPWMVPSLYVAPFKAHPKTPILDEFTLCKAMGRSWCTKTLAAHYASFITEQDFIDIAAAGLNHVRIPIGYWAFDISAGEPYTQGQLPFLQKGVLWAKKHNLSVIIDIHGQPASQNGFDNSGQRGSIGWLDKAANVKRSEAVLKALVAEFTKSAYGGAVTMFQPVNEPRATTSAMMAKLVNFYTDAFSIITAKSKAAWFVGHDAFKGLAAWNGVLKGKARAAMDTHIYSVFSLADAKFSVDDRRKYYCSRGPGIATATHVSIVGEWAPASNDCGQALPGLTYTSANQATTPGMFPLTEQLSPGACAGKTRSGAGFSAAHKNELRMWFDVQADVYEASSAGWVMWAWKLEDGAADDWSYQAGLKYGWIPKDPTRRKYPNQCK